MWLIVNVGVCRVSEPVSVVFKVYCLTVMTLVAAAYTVALRFNQDRVLGPVLLHHRRVPDRADQAAAEPGDAALVRERERERECGGVCGWCVCERDEREEREVMCVVRRERERVCVEVVCEIEKRGC